MSSKNLLTSIILPLLAVGLFTSSVVANPRAATGVQEVALVGLDHRGYDIDVLLGEVVPWRGVLDTGATQLVLPYEAYEALWRVGSITAADALPAEDYRLADGSLRRYHQTYVTLTIGTMRLRDVQAVIGPRGTTLLIGSAVLQRFQSFGVDHTRGILRLGLPR